MIQTSNKQILGAEIYQSVVYTNRLTDLSVLDNELNVLLIVSITQMN